MVSGNAPEPVVQVEWLEPGRGYGFPVPDNIRDLLVGDDKRFL